MSQIIMALDQGTTSSRTILFDENGKIIAQANAPLACHYPQSGWVEQVPEEIWSSQRQTIEEALAGAKLSMKDIAALPISEKVRLPGTEIPEKQLVLRSTGSADVPLIFVRN